MVLISSLSGWGEPSGGRVAAYAGVAGPSQPLVGPPGGRTTNQAHNPVKLALGGCKRPAPINPLGNPPS